MKNKLIKRRDSMQNDKILIKLVVIGIIIIFVGSSFVSANPREFQKIDLKKDLSTEATLNPGVIFVLDCSGSIDTQEFIGMKNAVKNVDFITCGECDVTGLRLGVVTFRDEAMISVPARVIDDEYTLEDFIYDVNHMPTAGGLGTEMSTGIDAAYRQASHMIVMTDQNPGNPNLALEACESARLKGQKISIAHYSGDYPGYFPFEECTNSDRSYPDQPIGFESFVSNPSEMTQIISSWVRNEFDLDCIQWC